MSEPGSIFTGFQWTGFRPAGFQEVFRAVWQGRAKCGRDEICLERCGGVNVSPSKVWWERCVSRNVVWQGGKM